jgi:hypothetical protein
MGKISMSTHISIEELYEEEGMSFNEFIEEYRYESVVPACCSHGCFVEPDGTCEHGNQSFLMELCLI